MKHKLFASLLLLTLLATSCSSGGNSTPIAEYTPNLPTVADKNVGNPKTDTEGNVLFDFYEMSDYHGATEYDKDSNELGLNRLGSYFDAKRTSNAGGTVILSSGDMWQGTADSNLTYGNLVTYGMDVIQFDAMELGNHEFDWSVDWIKNNDSRANFPFLCANLMNKGTTTRADFVDASTIITRGDYKIGVIGTIGDNIKGTILESAVADYDFANEVSIVSAEADNLRNNEDCDIVVWLTHNDVTYINSQLTNECADKIDLVFGGHSHTTTNITRGSLPLLETREHGRSIAHAQLSLNPLTGDVTASITEVDESPTSVDYAEDSNIKGIYDQYATGYINPVKNETVGKVSGGTLTIADSLSNLAVFSMQKVVTETLPDYNIVASFHNRNGGVRADIQSGTVIYGDVYKSFPFDNEIVILKISAYRLKFYLNQSGNYAMWQNIKISEITTGESYYIVTTDYLSSGTNPYVYFDEIVFTKLYVRDTVTAQIREASGGGAGCSSASLNVANYTTSNNPQFSKAA